MHVAHCFKLQNFLNNLLKLEAVYHIIRSRIHPLAVPDVVMKLFFQEHSWMGQIGRGRSREALSIHPHYSPSHWLHRQSWHRLELCASDSDNVCQE